MPKSGINKYHRRPMRMRGYDYSLEGAYFITISTYQRQILFGKIVDGAVQLNPYGNIAADQWIRLHSRFYPSDFSIFIIMPNHVHGIIHIVRGAGEEFEQVPPGIPPQRHDNNNIVIPGSEGVIDNVRGAGEGFEYAPLGIHPQRPYDIQNVIPGSLGAIIRAYKSSVTFRINATRGYTDPPIWQRNYYEHIIRNEKEYDTIRNYIETNPISWKDDRFNPIPTIISTNRPSN